MKNINLSKTLLVVGLLMSGTINTLNADTFTDKKTKLMWQDDVSVTTTKKDWYSAIAHCQNLTYAGHSDWRLPTIDELLSITDDTKHNPAIKSNLKNIASSCYWSSSPCVQSERVWTVFFGDGADSVAEKSYLRLLRCVRESK